SVTKNRFKTILEDQKGVSLFTAYVLLYSLLFLTNTILIKRVFLISAMFFKSIFVFNKQSLARLKSDMHLIFQILCLYPGKNFICKIPDCCLSFADQFQECQDV